MNKLCYPLFNLICSLIFLLSFSFFAAGQKTKISVSADINFPLGDFSSTHIAGIGAETIFGKSWPDTVKSKKLCFIYKAGLRYFPGEKQKISGFPYRYPGYYFIHAFAGIMYKLSNKINFALSAGPAIGIYNNSTRFTIGADLNISYSVKNNLSLGPVIIMMKESGAEGLWSVGLKGNLRF